jgi:hypothetical protein
MEHTMNLPSIEAIFTHIDKGHRVLNFSKPFYFAVPKYLIIINGYSFEYTDSVVSLSKHLKLQKNASLCLTEDLQLRFYYDKYITDDPTDILPNIIYWGGFTLRSIQPKLSETDKLSAFRCILRDAQIPHEYCMDDFLSEYSYDADLATVRKGESIYRACVDTNHKLDYSLSTIEEYLSHLESIGIE